MVCLLSPPQASPSIRSFRYYSEIARVASHCPRVLRPRTSLHYKVGDETETKREIALLCWEVKHTLGWNFISTELEGLAQHGWHSEASLITQSK